VVQALPFKLGRVTRIGGSTLTTERRLGVNTLPVARCPALRGGWSAQEERTMVSENDSSPRRHQDPWNKGRLIGQKHPLKPSEAERCLDHRVRLQLEGRKRHLALSMNGWQTLVSTVRPMAPTRCDGQNQLRFTRRPATCGRFSFSLDIRSAKVPSVISRSRSRTRSASQSRWSCEPIRSCGLASPAGPKPAKNLSRAKRLNPTPSGSSPHR
jgi:hypothetical protein